MAIIGEFTKIEQINSIVGDGNINEIFLNAEQIYTYLNTLQDDTNNIVSINDTEYYKKCFYATLFNVSTNTIHVVLSEALRAYKNLSEYSFNVKGGADVDIETLELQLKDSQVIANNAGNTLANNKTFIDRIAVLIANSPTATNAIANIVADNQTLKTDMANDISAKTDFRDAVVSGIVNSSVFLEQIAIKVIEYMHLNGVDFTYAPTLAKVTLIHENGVVENVDLMEKENGIWQGSTTLNGAFTIQISPKGGLQ